MTGDRGMGEASTGVEHRTPSSRDLLSLALTLAIVLVAFGSLAPLTLVESWIEFRRALLASLNLQIEPPIVGTLAERFLVFLPLGFLISLQRRRLPRFRRLRTSAGFTIGIALVIEVLQIVIAQRHARLTDFLLAGLFGCLGAAIGSAMRQQDGSGDIARPGRTALRWLLVGGVCLCNLALVSMLMITHAGLGISGWDCSYPLLIGNEATQNRPWLGKIRGLAIYDRIPSKAEMTALAGLPMTADQSEARRHAGAIAIYAFDSVQGLRVPDLGGKAGGSLDLGIARSSNWGLARGAIEIGGPLLIQSNGAAKALCERIEGSGAFAVEIEFASADFGQSGPARIVSMSSDPFLRNFTLGQEYGALILRVRTPRNGPNGIRLQTHTGDGVITGGWQHAWVGYGKGKPQIVVDDVPARLSLPDHQLLLLGEERPVPISQMAALLCFVGGALSAFLLAGRRLVSRLPLGWAAAGALPLLGAVGLQAWYGYGFDWAFAVTTLAAPALGVVAGWILLHHPDRQTRP